MRLIDADALLADCIFTSKGLEMFMKEFLDDAPTVDAVPVVRCKDCKWFTRYEEHKCRGTGGSCSMLKPEGDGHFICWGDWYCADGERKNDQ